jgi:ubiquitin C-terminal hydrolase
LSGILVHSGGANSGHYYSYIKERSGSERWLEFNDTTVKDFDISNLAAKCFGTPVDGPKADAWHSHANAYLLFYEQVE